MRPPGRLGRAILLLCAAQRVSALVTCRFTVDNIVDGVWLNGAPLSFTGTATHYPSVKVVQFDGSGTKRLAISGRDTATTSCGCSCSGLAVVCSATTETWWDGIVSSLDWKAYGSTTSGAAPTGWTSAGSATQGFGTPCTSSSGFSLRGYSGYTKIWPSTGGQYASFYIEITEPSSGTAVAPPPINLALGKPAAISSAWNNVPASRCTDGNTASQWNEGSCVHSLHKADTWWRVDIGSVVDIGLVRIYNRADSCCGWRLSGFKVYTGSDLQSVTSNFDCGNSGVSTTTAGQIIAVDCLGRRGRYVWVYLPFGTLNICEVEVFEQPKTVAPTQMPTTVNPTTQAPSSASPTSGAPSTGSPTTASPTTESPTTASPVTEGPTTTPTTAGPSTAGPTSTSPTTESPTTASPSTAGPTSTSPTTAAPATEAPTTAPTTAGPSTAGPTSTSPTTESPATGGPTAAPTTAGPSTVGPTSTGPTTASPLSASPITAGPQTLSPSTDSPATAAPLLAAQSAGPTASPTDSPTSRAPLPAGVTRSPATSGPTAEPTASPATASPATASPATAGPTASPTTVAPSGSPATEAPATVGPTASPATAAPTTAFTPSPTEYSTICSPLAATLQELKAKLPSTNGTDGVCGQINRGLTRVIDAGQYTQALDIINNSTARVAALQSAPESCATYLDFQCNANDNVATTVQRLDVYMKAAFNRLQTLMASSGGNRNGLSLVQTMIQIVKTTSLTQAERNDFSESAGNFTERANATDLAQTTYAQDIADLLAALIDKNAEAAEAESAPMSSDACASVAKAFERVERLLHKAGTALTVGGGARRLDTSMFESWSSRVDATGRGQLQPSGATLSLPRFSYQANSAATAGDIVILVALRWKSRVDLCRKSSDLSLESEIHTVSALGDASRMADDVYFATGEMMDMMFTARTSSSRAAQRTTGCSGPKECRWWNTATQAWDPTGCTYSESTGSCSCTHLTDFAVVAPAVACPEAEAGATSSGASSMIFVAVGAAVVVVGIIIYFVMRKRNRKKYGKVFGASKASIVPRTNSEESMHRSERGEAKIGWEECNGVPEDNELGNNGGKACQGGSEGAVDSEIQVLGVNQSEVSGEQNIPGSTSANSTEGGEVEQLQQALESSSESEGISGLSSHVLPVLAAATLQEEETKAGQNMPGLPGSPSPSAISNERGELQQLQQALESSSESEGISNLPSHVLPDFASNAPEPGVRADEPTPSSFLEEEDTKVPSPDDEDAEYMRRCQVKFALLSQEYEMDVAMEMYDDFLAKAKDQVLAEPAAKYQLA